MSDTEDMRRKLLLQYQALCAATEEVRRDTKKKRRNLKKIQKKMARVHTENIILKYALVECASKK